MPSIRTLADAENFVMSSASACFAIAITPVIQPQVMALTPAQRVVWWDGFLASAVGAMAATIGEQATKQVCDDLYERAKDFTADLERKHGSG